MNKIVVAKLDHYLNGGGIWHEWVVLAVGLSQYAGSFIITETFSQGDDAVAYAVDLAQQYQAMEANNIVSFKLADC